MKEIQRVVVSGSVVANGGDAAIMFAQLSALRSAFPEAKFLILDSDPVIARKIFPAAAHEGPLLAPRLRRRRGTPGFTISETLRLLLLNATQYRLLRIFCTSRMRHVLRLITTADLLAYTGGTTLIDKYGVEGKLVEVEVAQKAGVATVLLPQSLGPFAHPDTRARVRSVVDRSSQVLLRDERSRSHLIETGAKATGVAVVPDIVFNLMSDFAVERIRRSSFPQQPRVVISARDITAFASDGDSGQRRYERQMKQVVTRLVRDYRAEITFMSTCQGIESYHHDDSAIALRIYESLDVEIRQHVQVNRNYHSPQSLHELYREFDLAIVTRLHAGITALNVGVPVLPVAYEFKTVEVFDDLGFGHLVTSVDDRDAPLLANLLLLIAGWKDYTSLLSSRLSSVQARVSSIPWEIRKAHEQSK